MNKIVRILAAITLVLLLSFAVTAQAVCPQNGVTQLEVGPANPQNGFPQWFRDTNGRAAELCLDDRYCFFDPVDPANPFSQQIGFGPEAFWWSADAVISNGTVDALLVLAVEAAFANEDPADGEQFPFTRLRIRVDVPAPGIYTITHPYGQEVFNVTAIGAGNDINMSRDIPVTAFNSLHNGAVGPLLLAVNPLPPAGFFGDFNIEQTVTGSPCDTNFFSIQAPGVNLGAGVGNPVSTNLFAVQGKFFTGLLNAPLTVTRSSYSRTNPGAVNLFANSAPTATLQVSGTPNFPTNPVTMTHGGAGKFFAHVPITNTTTLPAFLTFTATNTGDTQTTINSLLVDEVTVTAADYNMTNGSLTIQATSSDLATPLPTLTALGLGTLTAGAFTTTLAIPPPTVTVTSSKGGSDTQIVRIISAFAISGTITNSAGGTPMSGVTVTLSGAANATTTTGSNGAYSFTGLANGSYTVTPSLAGFTFAPVNRGVVITNASVGAQDFVGTQTAGSFSITGRVGAGGGVGLPGVTITLGGTASRTTTTNANGNYSFTGLGNGSYTVTPALLSYAFTPPVANVTINGANQTAVSFTATGIYSISGTITNDLGTGVQGFTINLTGTTTGGIAVTRSAVTNAIGGYSLANLPNGTYTVTPAALAGGTWEPANRVVIINNANLTAQNFRLRRAR